jgi:putative Ca2+/H+ antiporter (TMEM165/GDT1 family)
MHVFIHSLTHVILEWNSNHSTQAPGLVGRVSARSQNLRVVHPHGSFTPSSLWGTLDNEDELDLSSLSLQQQQQQHVEGEKNTKQQWRTLAVAMTAAAVLATAVPGPASAAVGTAVTAAASQANAWRSALAETGFYQAFSLVFVSEIGDKTFFIAGLLAMKTSRLISFVGSIAALSAMTVVSVVLGQVFHAVPSGFADGVPLDDIAAVAAFTFFGLKTLKEAFDMEEGESAMDEELADAEEAVSTSRTITEVTRWGQIASIFGLVFAAEFGDRSFLSTIALSAAQNPISVGGGAIAAHAVATGIAVSGGAYVSKYISEKVIGIIGGTLFLIFAVTTALGIF